MVAKPVATRWTDSIVKRATGWTAIEVENAGVVSLLFFPLLNRKCDECGKEEASLQRPTLTGANHISVDPGSMMLPGARGDR